MLEKASPSPLLKSGGEAILQCSWSLYLLSHSARSGSGNDGFVNLRRNELCLFQLRSSASLLGNQPGHMQHMYYLPLTTSSLKGPALVGKTWFCNLFYDQVYSIFHLLHATSYNFFFFYEKQRWCFLSKGLIPNLIFILCRTLVGMKNTIYWTSLK